MILRFESLRIAQLLTAGTGVPMVGSSISGGGFR